VCRLTLDGERSLDGVVALLLTGGEDVCPSLYGEVNRCCERTNPARDKFELELLDIALKRQLPVLAVCRGMQLLCVALGGSLHQDLSQSRLVRPEADVFLHRGAGHTDTTHKVHVVPGSLLGRIIETEFLFVNSHHHQGVKRLPSCFRPAAFADDGLTEAAEGIVDGTFILGVQWHPERWDHASSTALMSALLAAAQGFAFKCRS
jgi:putative glutamine amidotransferase